jgi:hypothetical protein
MRMGEASSLSDQTAFAQFLKEQAPGEIVFSDPFLHG